MTDDPWSELGLFAVLRAPVVRPFAIPTFPEPEMFVRLVDQPATLMTWYRCLHRVLQLPAHEVSGRLLDNMNMVRFPVRVPWAQMSGHTARYGDDREPGRQHLQVCTTLRQGLLAAGQGELVRAGQIFRQVTELLQSLMAHVTRYVHEVGPPGAAGRQDGALSAVDIDGQIAGFVAAHREWVTGFRSFLDHLDQHGIAVWDRIEEAGDFRRCRLGQVFALQGGVLLPYRHLPEVREMDRLHKQFHATVAVEANIMVALRVRGLTGREQERLERKSHQHWEMVESISQRLVHQIRQAFLAAQRAEQLGHVAAQPADGAERLHPVPFTRVAAAIREWEARVCRFIERPEADATIDQILLHTGCAFSTRIDAVMDDPLLMEQHGSVLRRVDELHRRQHATAAVMVAMVRDGQRDEARRLRTSLVRHCDDLLEMLRAAGTLLRIDSSR
jgi:hypothetical protein